MPVTIKLKDHYRGDHWIGILRIGPIQINTGTLEVPVLAPMSSPCASARIQFRDANGVLGYELSTTPADDTGTITVLDADTWEFTVPVQPLPLDAGTWTWDFETTGDDDVVLTPYKGTLEVDPDQSRD